MVSTDNLRYSGSEDDMSMTSFNDDVIMRRNSAESEMQCPHCAFRCASPSIMTQHSWEMHPLLMRQKKHLITSSRPDELSSGGTSQFHTQDIEISNAPSAYQPAQIHETALEMKNCSLSNEESRSLGGDKFDQQSQDRYTAQYTARQNAARSLSLLSDAAAILDAAPEQACESAPQRHVAVVKPVPVEAQRQVVAPTTTNMQQTTTMLPQYINKDHLVYAPLYNAYIPSLNQYVSIPIPVATGLFPTPTMINQNFETTMKNYLNVQPLQNTQFLPTLTQTQIGPIPQPPQSAPLVHPQPVAAQSGHIQRQSGPQFRKNVPEAPTGTKEIRTLLKTVPAVRNVDIGQQGQFNLSQTSIKTEPLNGHTLATHPLSKNTSLGRERQEALEKALLSTDCCDINDSSTTMPFKCPDGVWRMVKFKCIRGLWLVQIPGSPTPTVYVPCEDGKVLKQAKIQTGAKTPPQAIGHKRKLSDPTGISNGLEVKRLCASAPVEGAKPQPGAANVTPMVRTRSNPSLPEPKQHFTSSEGKRVNISMIKHKSTPTSGSLIKTLLLRKPTPSKYMTSSTPTIPMTSSHVNSMTSAITNGRMQCKSSSGQQISSTFARPAQLNTNSMVY